MKRQILALFLMASLLAPIKTATAFSQEKSADQETSAQKPDEQSKDAPADGQTKAAPANPQAQAEETKPCKTKDGKPCKSKDDVSQIGNRDPGKSKLPNFYSLEKEVALGKQLAQEVERSAKFIDDPVVIAYVNKVGQNLVRNSDARIPFVIKVIDSDVVNAFALPGGFFYVNSGLILHADFESELAGVMAHEISHVVARHGTKNASKAELVQLGLTAASIFIPYGIGGYLIGQGMTFLIPITFLKFSRDAEREADYLGLQYMYKAGYDPNSFVSFFEKVEAEEKKQPGTMPKIFSSHPPTPDRIEAIQKEIATILPALDQYVLTTSEFDVVKARLRNGISAKKTKPNDPDKPTLRTKTEQTTKQPTSDDSGSTNTGENPGSTDDDRPTLKRRPDDQ